MGKFALRFCSKSKCPIAEMYAYSKYTITSELNCCKTSLLTVKKQNTIKWICSSRVYWSSHIFFISLSTLFIPNLSGAGGQWLRTSSGLVGTGRGHVWDDVWPVALLQPGPRASLWANPHGGDPLPQEPGSWSQGPAGRSAQKGSQTKVCGFQLMYAFTPYTLIIKH